MTEYRYSERGCIRPHDLFRARGGETYRGSRVGCPGRYRLIGIESQGERVYLEAVPCDRNGLPTGGCRLLYVSGAPYRMAALETMVMRPYRVSRLRSQSRNPIAKAKRCPR